MKVKDFLDQEEIKNEIKRRISYNPVTGELIWKQRGSIFFDDNYAGKSCLQTWVCKDGYKMSVTKPTLFGRPVSIMGGRLAWFLYYGDWPKHTIDHINKNSLDHRIENLRDVTQKKTTQIKVLISVAQQASVVPQRWLENIWQESLLMVSPIVLATMTHQRKRQGLMTRKPRTCLVIPPP